MRPLGVVRECACVCWQGRDLLRASTVRDYRVLLDDVECEVLSVDNDTLSFMLPVNQTLPSTPAAHVNATQPTANAHSTTCPVHYPFSISVSSSLSLHSFHFSAYHIHFYHVFALSGSQC